MCSWTVRSWRVTTGLNVQVNCSPTSGVMSMIDCGYSSSGNTSPASVPMPTTRAAERPIGSTTSSRSGLTPGVLKDRTEERQRDFGAHLEPELAGCVRGAKLRRKDTAIPLAVVLARGGSGPSPAPEAILGVTSGGGLVLTHDPAAIELLAVEHPNVRIVPV
jgi:hypothetical protein